jgi:hypothetical protein
MKPFRIKLSGKIYGIIGLSFIALFGVAALQLIELKSSLEEQKKIELRHLVESYRRILVTRRVRRQRFELAI